MLSRPIRWLPGRRGLARRIYFAFLVAAVLPTAIAGIIGVTLSLDQLRKETLRHLSQEVSVRAGGLSMFFDQLAAELRYLADAPAIAELRLAIRGGDAAMIASLTRRLERDYSALASAYPHIYQIRYLSADGRERVRVDRRDGKVVVVPPPQLQDKSDRYYFTETMRQRAGELYVSPLDLNVEFGVVETPERPVVRIAIPLGDGRASNDGILVVNLHADILLAQIEDMARTREGTAYLFDRSGHYLARSARAASGFSMQAVEVLAPVFGADKVARILGAGEGTLTAGGRIVAHAPIEFGSAYARPAASRWVIAVDLAERNLFFSVFNLYVLYAVLTVALVVTAVGGYILSRRLLGPLDVLARETQTIAGGDFSRRVQIAGDDEIADLGGKFNVMTDRLSDLYRKLEAHRDRLEDEVSARTRELDRERAFLATIIRNTADGILVVGGEGQIALANPAAILLLGLAGEQAGESLAESWPEWPAVAAEVSAETPLRREMQVNGRVLAMSITLIASPVGSPWRVVVVRDISEERHLQDERRELDRQLFQMDKMATMGELAMGMAHEIGNPLAGMKAVAQALQYEEDLPAGVAEALRRLESETDRLANFLRTFHGFAAPTVPDLQPIQFDDALADVLFWTRKEAANQRVTIRTDVPVGLPPLSADLAQLKQVLLNLVVNGLRAMPQGGFLDIAASRDGERLRFTIADTGVGIAPQLLARIFEPFFTTRPGGSGLGLSIVHKIVREHGADIEVTSEPGHGSCFVVLWPTHTGS